MSSSHSTALAQLETIVFAWSVAKRESTFIHTQIYLQNHVDRHMLKCKTLVAVVFVCRMGIQSCVDIQSEKVLK